jgi:histidine triad (HIT) family protein
MNDIFEKIIAREIPAEIIYEDETVIAFLSIEPVNKGHALVVPKVKFVNIFDANPTVLGHMMGVAQKIAIAIKSSVKADGVNILMNNESSAGQEVFHAHIHVIPRFTGDNAYGHAKHTPYVENEIAEYGILLKKTIS